MIFTDGLRLESPDRPVTDFAASWGAQLGATAAEAWSDSPTSQILGITEINAARGGARAMPETDILGSALGGPQAAEEGPSVPTLSRADAVERLKQAGLDKRVTLPAQDTIATPVLDIMMQRARERAEREATIERGPQGFWYGAAELGTSFLVGAVDPINLASAFIPVMGELRYGKLLASAGESVIARNAARAGVGAVQGVVGQAVLEPLDWYAHTQEGRDFGMSDVLRNLVFGAALGGGLQTGGGIIADVYRSRRGRPLYPFGPGEPLEQVPGARVSAQALEEGVPATGLPDHLLPVIGQIEDVLNQASTPPALRVLQDLPPKAQEDSMRAAIAAITSGEPVRVGEMLAAAARTDPRIAESFEAFHGSPHEFDRFDVSKINTGEGAQSYGHGLYFAENESVAAQYRLTVSDKAFIRKARELYGEFDGPEDAHLALAESKDFSPSEKRLLQALEKDDWLGFEYPHQAVSAALREPQNFDLSPATIKAIKELGHIYRVKVNADQAHFLDWNKPLSEQGDHVRAGLAKLGIDETVAASGEDAFRQLAQERVRYGEPDANGMRRDLGKQDASVALRDAGIPGIKYLDQGSRNAGEGTRNFVVFDDKHVQITHRNGEPLPLKTDAPLAGLVTKPKSRGRAAAHPDTWSLNEFLASKGGLKPDPELAAIYGGKRGPFLPGFGPLIRKNGMSLDEALTAAKEHGYMFDPHDAENGTAGAGGRTSMGLTPRDLLDALDAENRGQKLYKAGHLEATKHDVEQERHVVLGHVETELEGAGLKISDVDPRLIDRTVEIVHREGEQDVMAAYERAIIEDEERYNAIAADRDADPTHPARAVPFDGGAAPAGRGANPAAGGPGGLEPGGRGADRPQPSGDGPGDRAAAADGYRRLADVTPEHDQPDILAASRAADATPEIKTRLDDRVTAATQAEADSAELYKMFANGLSEEQRMRLEDAIKSLDDDHALQSDVIERAAACAFRGRA